MYNTRSLLPLPVLLVLVLGTCMDAFVQLVDTERIVQQQTRLLLGPIIIIFLIFAVVFEKVQQ